MSLEAGAPRAPRPPGWRLWLAFFAYTAVAALAVQMVVVPHLLPSADARGSLLFGLDSWTFHQIATQQATQIRAIGWSAWTLRPNGQVPAGIASAIYALTVPEPWTLIPLNAALHATAALVLLLIVESLVRDRRVALAATMPFLLYPSAMSWFAQLHKDGWFILGALLFAYGWLGLARQDTWTRGLVPPLRSSAWIWLGSLAIWAMRGYGAILCQALGIALAVLVTIVFITRGVMASVAWRHAVAASIVSWLMVGGISVLASQESPVAPPGPRESALAERLARLQSSSWLPAVIDRPLRDLATARETYLFRYPEALTNIDTDVSFRGASDVLAYLPRAAVIVLFAPFPDQWLRQSATESGTLMRRVAAVEMIGLYLALALLPLAIWRWRRRIELHVVAGYCLAMMVVYGTAVPNIGALYRFRYAFIMTLAALGIAGGASAWRGIQPAGDRGRLGAEGPSPRPGREVPDRPSTAIGSGG